MVHATKPLESPSYIREWSSFEETAYAISISLLVGYVDIFSNASLRKDRVWRLVGDGTRPICPLINAVRLMDHGLGRLYIYK
jgi:hypothetical protein